MKRIGELLFGLLLMACSPGKIDMPEAQQLRLNMATEGVGNFTDYIHSLSIYAFRITAGGDYVYVKTLAKLDESGIAALDDFSARGNAKLFSTELGVGTYELYFVGNATGSISGDLREEVTRPSDVLLMGNSGGLDSVYFVGKVNVKLVTDITSPISVVLKRVVSKLVVVLDGVPSQIASIRLSVGNIAPSYSLTGEMPPSGQVVEKTFVNAGSDVSSRDTVVCELLTLPTTGTTSPFSLTFTSKSGVERTKEMPSLTLLPDKYTRVKGIISEQPGSALSFDIAVTLFIFDKWGEDNLPDFPITPDN